ncbi:hypothetical protein Tco_0032961 [Tanacetum coccineum]
MHAFWSLNEDNLKIIVLKTNMSYPSRKIRRICACTHQRPRRKQDLIRRILERQYAVFKLYGNKIFWKISNVVPTRRNPKYVDGRPKHYYETIHQTREEKALKHGKVFNWDTARYSKIWYDEDVHDLRSVETEFPAIVFNDNLTSNETPSCEPTVSSLNNNKIDFRISFDESDDEDYTILKNEFPAIVYNDALMSKSDFSTEPTLCPQHIDEFDLKDETSLSEYDEVEQNVLYLNDLFPFT